ncbi:MotA/TolQ/ExbB proton channel family protein [bacterium]|nr:MotA/TolQ/ExbB proton channel family protein [bacterium]
MYSSLIALSNVAVGTVDIVEVVKNSTFIVNMILLGLVIASGLCWGVIGYKIYIYRKAVKATEKFVAIFWKNMNYREVFEQSDKYKDSPIALVFRAGYTEFTDTKLAWEERGAELKGVKVEELTANIERAMRRENQTMMQLLENYLPILATTATASPFVGLFGTVWGIMNAFHEIGKTGSATLGTIAPSLSEALVTTAFGLIAAIPAAIFYNYFNSVLQRFDSESTNIIADFLNYIKRSFV